MKTKALLSSVLTIVLCLSVIAGSSFALFTSSSQLNAAVTSGKVSVIATAGELTYSSALGSKLGESSASKVDNVITIDKMVPGDKIEFDITIRNASDVTVNCRTVFTKVEDDGLWEALRLTIAAPATEDLPTVTDLGEGDTAPQAVVTPAGTMAPGCADILLHVCLEMPIESGNEYQGRSCCFAYTVEAIQGNAEFAPRWSGAAAPLVRDESTPANVKTLADVTDTEAKTVKIETPELLAALAQSVNAGNSYYGYTVTLETDIDLANINWTPIGKPTRTPDASGNPTGNVIAGAFSGNFDGKGHTISNLKVNGGAASPIDPSAMEQGLFGCLNAHGNMAYVQNLNIHNADIYAKNSAGAFVGCLDTYQHTSQSGQSNIWNVNLTGKVTIKGGKSGSVCGSPVAHWAILTSLQNVTVNVDAGSYVTNVGVAGAGGNVGGVGSVAAYSSGWHDITSNIDVIAAAGGEVGGIVGVASGKFYDLTYTGDITIVGADATASKAERCGLLIGVWAPLYRRDLIEDDRLAAGGNFTIRCTDDSEITVTQKVGCRAW